MQASKQASTDMTHKLQSNFKNKQKQRTDMSSRTTETPNMLHIDITHLPNHEAIQTNFDRFDGL